LDSPLLLRETLMLLVQQLEIVARVVEAPKDVL
jgi:hypothetical protein